MQAPGKHALLAAATLLLSVSGQSPLYSAAAVVFDIVFYVRIWLGQQARSCLCLSWYHSWGTSHSALSLVTAALPWCMQHACMT